jgi:hypothetical protein
MKIKTSFRVTIHGLTAVGDGEVVDVNDKAEASRQSLFLPVVLSVKNPALAGD